MSAVHVRLRSMARTLGHRVGAASANGRAALAALMLASGGVALPASAAVELRVEAQPIADPIQVYASVTDAGNGSPVTGLASPDFAVTLDGVALSTTGFAQPPSQDPNRRLSVLFVMDYSRSVQDVFKTQLETVVITFINNMTVGDRAAVIKFNDTLGVGVIQPFTQLDGGANTQALRDAVTSAYAGQGSPVIDAINDGIAEFAAATLPVGPKAIIVVTDGGDNSSVIGQSDVVAAASANDIRIFTVGVGNVAGAGGLDLLNNLADQSGGQYLPAPDDAAIAAAYATLSGLLANEYRLTLPANAVTDCDVHTISVTVAGQTGTTTFSRCDTTPNNFTFFSRIVDRSVVAVSNTVTIGGIDTAAPVTVTGGEYSIGCTSTFTTAAGTIDAGDTVCVRHTSPSTYATATSTTLSIGGVSSTFRTTTVSDVSPDAFTFADRTGVDVNSTVTSAAVTIGGIAAAAPISVTGGEYSIGCNSTFTAAEGTINNGQTVCVRHTSAATANTSTTTTLTIGGVSGTFQSTTAAAQAQSGGGGGSTGAVELLLGLAAFAATRRRRLPARRCAA